MQKIKMVDPEIMYKFYLQNKNMYVNFQNYIFINEGTIALEHPV